MMKIELDMKELYEKILDENGSIIFLSDIETYEMVYATRSTLRILGRPLDDTSYIGQKCYEVLQGRQEPCEFCNNNQLSFTEYYCWEHFNPIMNRYFSKRDKMIVISGHKLRLEIAEDISHLIKEKQKLEEDLGAEKSMMICIQNMTAAESGDQTVKELLEKVCSLYEGDRGYIFEFDYQQGTSTNTYEWCRQGVQPQKARLQYLPLEYSQPWIDIFSNGGDINIGDVQSELDHDSCIYKILAVQDITSLAAVPLLKGEDIVGFIGVDNPVKKPEDLSLFKMIAQFVANDIEKRRILQELAQSSNIDLLAKVYNRNRYISDVRKMNDDKTMETGVIFLDLDNLKEVNDTFGHDRGDELIKRTASILYAYFPDEVYRIGGDEFIVLNRKLDHKEFEEMSKQLRGQFEKEQIRISMGVSWHFRGKDLKESILKADDLMYQEKSGNKNNKRYYRDIEKFGL